MTSFSSKSGWSLPRIPTTVSLVLLRVAEVEFLAILDVRVFLFLWLAPLDKKTLANARHQEQNMFSSGVFCLRHFWMHLNENILKPLNLKSLEISRSKLKQVATLVIKWSPWQIPEPESILSNPCDMTYGIIVNRVVRGIIMSMRNRKILLQNFQAGAVHSWRHQFSQYWITQRAEFQTTKIYMRCRGLTVSHEPVPVQLPSRYQKRKWNIRR